LRPQDAADLVQDVFATLVTQLPCRLFDLVLAETAG